MYAEEFATTVIVLDEFDDNPEAPLKFTEAVTPNPFAPAPLFVNVMRITNVEPAMYVPEPVRYTTVVKTTFDGI